MWLQKLNKLDDRKISILKKGIGIESEKYANKLEIKKCENKLKMELSDHRTRDKQKSNSKAFAIPILTACGL